MENRNDKENTTRVWPEPGDYTWLGGRLAAEPREMRYQEKDGLTETVIYMTLAVNHARWPVSYVEVEARGMQRIYVENLITSPSRPLRKGAFVIAGGIIAPRRKRKTLLLKAFSADTSYGFDPIDSKPKAGAR